MDEPEYSWLEIIVFRIDGFLYNHLYYYRRLAHWWFYRNRKDVIHCDVEE